VQVQLYEVTAKPNQSLDYSSDANQRSKNAGLKLLNLSAKCSVSPDARPSSFMLTCDQTHGMSGRSLRRLPVLALAHSLGLGQPVSAASKPVSTKPMMIPFEMGMTDIESWIAGMDAIIDIHGDEIQRII
jgi:pachytene checkpoint protein 2